MSSFVVFVVGLTLLSGLLRVSVFAVMMIATKILETNDDTILFSNKNKIEYIKKICRYKDSIINCTKWEQFLEEYKEYTNSIDEIWYEN